MHLLRNITRAARRVRGRTLSLIAFAAIAPIGLAGLSAGAGAAGAQQPMQADRTSPDARRLDAALDDARKIEKGAEPDKARAAYEAIRTEAERLGLAHQTADALLGLAAVEGSQERAPVAMTLTERALGMFKQMGDERSVARAERQLGAEQAALSRNDEAKPLLYRSRDTFARLGEHTDLAWSYYSILYQLELSEREAMLPEAIAAARAGTVPWLECGMLHSVGDAAFANGNYALAYQRLTDALTCFEHTDRIGNKGRVLVSLGRIERAHGQYERALAFYEQAYALQQQVHDEPAAIQSLNAIAVAYGYMGRAEDALPRYEEGLARARKLKSERFIAFMTGNLGGCYLELGRYEEGLAIVQESLKLEKDNHNRAYRYWQAGGALEGLGRLEEARTSLDQAVILAHEGAPDLLLRVLASRARIAQRMKRLDDSDADLREALALVEDLRSKTVAQDFMKRGFGESTQEVFSAAIDVRAERGDARSALETAEQARARAFLDLLASRHTEPAVVGMVASTGPTVQATSLPVGSARSGTGLPLNIRGDSDGKTASNGKVTDRGSAAGSDAVAPYVTARRVSDLESPRSVTAPNTDEMIATARRLGSTLLVYWVGRRATFAWVITPAGEISCTTIKVDANKLAELARSTTNWLKNGNGAALTLIGASQTKPWRDLYQILIKPVRAHLPATAGSLLTVVPHGPLFQVSFAALQDENGRYLIESYRLHYTPSVGVLTYTAQTRRRLVDAGAKALLVGDPEPAAVDPDDEALADLPWARREVTEIGALLGARHARVVANREATEGKVREEIERASLLHFATHGVIRQNESMSSFLALARTSDAPGTASPGLRAADARTDGKLTADEVYGLRLHADLVVLSACGTALGPMTGDGVIGFTRAFLYAGARSVIATEWNVPDQTGYELMRRFYRFRRAGSNTSDALRSAQISMLSALRHGTLRVGAPGDQVALRENPLFWAGFVLVGEP
jgi:CHAT domain-containing protein/tetratricopeptide (TPR) repeat protein